MNPPRCLYCKEQILNPKRKNQRFCNVTLGKDCHYKFKTILRGLQLGKPKAEQYRIKYRMYNPEKVRQSNRETQKRFKDRKRMIKRSLLSIMLQGNVD